MVLPVRGVESQYNLSRSNLESYLGSLGVAPLQGSGLLAARAGTLWCEEWGWP